MRNWKRSSLLYFLLLCLSSCHIGRFVVWNFADLRDYKKFPAHEIAAPETAFRFAYAPDSIQQKLAAAKVTANGTPYTLSEYVGDYGKSVSFLIIRRDTILYEGYFDGYQADAPPVPSFSVAKSFVSALVGFAVQDGYIESVQDPVTRYLPELREADPQFDSLTLEHLLDMRSGLKFNENSYVNPFAPIAKFYYGKNIKKYILQTPFEAPPGSEREYQSVNTQLLGLVLERVTDKSLAAYLEEKIWQPLGMEFPASWSYDSKKHRVTKAYCCLNAQARDFAKFGRLYLKHGRWQGEQLLDSAWVAESIQPDYDNDCYQYQWYSSEYRVTVADSAQAVREAPPGKAIRQESDSTYSYADCGPDFMAIGILGQYIYVHPEKELIMVRQGKNDEVGYRQLFRALADDL